MKERIRKSIEKEPELKSQLEKIDSAYITTFDSFALSTVKKYHYLLNVSSNISIIDASIIYLEKKKAQTFVLFYKYLFISFIIP